MPIDSLYFPSNLFIIKQNKIREKYQIVAEFSPFDRCLTKFTGDIISKKHNDINYNIIELLINEKTTFYKYTKNNKKYYKSNNVFKYILKMP